MNDSFDMNKAVTDVFWGEMPPCDHVAQIYETDQVFLDTLEGFVAGGLRAGDGVIVIATGSHLASLEDRLRASGHDLELAAEADRYVSCRAEDALAEFMINGWPDHRLFERTVQGLLTRAKGPGRTVRAFGEMVALLWAQGYAGATVHLEHLWHDLCKSRGFSLFCAYPKVGFTDDAVASLSELCAVHSRVIPGAAGMGTAQ